jgi:pantothenate synthetase
VFGVASFALVEADTMRRLEALFPPGGDPARLVAAARLGTVRLLDNVAVPPGPAPLPALGPGSSVP